jgi:hypothetical protein
MSESSWWFGRSLNVVLHGVRLRSRDLGVTQRRVVLPSSAFAVAIVLVIGLATNGFGLLSSSGPTKGSMPYDAPHGPSYASIPDFVSVYVNNHTTGYTPKAYVAAPNGARNTPLLGTVAPVYASNLTTLLGHEYPGIGFVPIGESPWKQPCRTADVISTSAGGKVVHTPIPCPSTLIVLPDVAGAVTPTGVGKLSGLGVGVDVVNVRSKIVAPGHIVRTVPRGGSTLHGRQQVVVYNSIP